MVRIDEHRREFRIGEITVALRCDRAEPLEDFNSLYDASPGTTDTGSTIQMEIRSAPRSPFHRDRFAVYGDGQAFGTLRRREEVVPFVEWGINWRIIETRTDFLQVHSATMTREGRGYIFAGTSGVGKSTLAAGLLTRGWRYLSDEFALIDPDTIHLHPFPKALCIKSGSFGEMKRLGVPFASDGCYVKALKGRVSYVRPRDVRPDAVAERAPVDFVIFPKFVGSGKPRLRAIPRAQAAVLLAGHALNRHQFGGRATSILCDIVKNADCFALESTAIGDTCDLLDTLS